MKKIMAVAVVLMMVFAFGIAGIQAQQADTKDHGAMMKADCPMMARADSMKCGMGKEGKCPMAAEKCPMSSHHASTTDTGHGTGEH